MTVFFSRRRVSRTCLAFFTSFLSTAGITFLLIFFSALTYAEEPQSQTQTPILADQEGQQTEQKQSLSEKKNYSFLSGQTLSHTAEATKKETVNTDALSVSLGLIFILIIIFSLAWFMKKIGYSNLTGQGQLKIIATLNLGQKEKIALIQVGQQQLLVGMTATQINTLHILDELIESPDERTEDKDPEAVDKSFANKLSKFLINTPSNAK